MMDRLIGGTRRSTSAQQYFKNPVVCSPVGRLGLLTPLLQVINNCWNFKKSGGMSCFSRSRFYRPGWEESEEDGWEESEVEGWEGTELE